MAIPKKGSRKIVVDNVLYRWRIRWKPSYSQECQDNCLCAAAEIYENPQSALHIAFPWARYKLYSSFNVEPVTPRHIELMIRKALEKGWQPNKNGNFEVTHEIDQS